MRVSEACAPGQCWRLPGLGCGFKGEWGCEGAGKLGLQTLRPAWGPTALYTQKPQSGNLFLQGSSQCQPCHALSPPPGCSIQGHLKGGRRGQADISFLSQVSIPLASSSPSLRFPGPFLVPRGQCPALDPPFPVGSISASWRGGTRSAGLPRKVAEAWASPRSGLEWSNVNAKPLTAPRVEGQGA